MHAPMGGRGLVKVRADLASQKAGSNKLKWGKLVLLLATVPAPNCASFGIFVAVAAPSRIHAAARKPGVKDVAVLNRMCEIAGSNEKACGHE